MQGLESSDNVGSLDRIQICFALGKAHEDSNDYDSAFAFYARGNELKLPLTHYDPKQLHKRVQAQIDVCTTDFFLKRQKVGNEARDPIFIVGLPRAGSTLLEQIIASHSQVDGTMELHNILDLAKRLRGRDADRNDSPRYPGIMANLENHYSSSLANNLSSKRKSIVPRRPCSSTKCPTTFFT